MDQNQQGSQCAFSAQSQKELSDGIIAPSPQAMWSTQEERCAVA